LEWYGLRSRPVEAHDVAEMLLPHSPHLVVALDSESAVVARLYAAVVGRTFFTAERDALDCDIRVVEAASLLVVGRAESLNAQFLTRLALNLKATCGVVPASDLPGPTF